MIEVTTLGPVSVRVDGGAAPAELLWRKNLALLVYLASSPRRTRSRDQLVALLWADRPETAARHSLREAVRQLRAALGEAGIVTEGQQLRLADGVVRLDTERFAALAAAGDLEGAAALAHGDFLEGFGVPDAGAFEDWLAAERPQWRRRCLDALTQAAARRLRAGDTTAAQALADRALALDPCAEDAARAAMSAAALAGDRTLALQVFDELGRRLRQALGTEPSPVTRELEARIRSARQVTAPARAQAPRGAESRRAPFVGRGEALAALAQAWTACTAGARAAALVVSGDPGTGRSRLLDEFAARVRLEGGSVVTARAVPGDRVTPWAGLLAIASGGLLEAPGVAGAPPSAIAAFAAMLPVWQEKFPGAAAQTALPLNAALAATLRVVAEERPVLVVVDDAAWLDTASLRALEGVLRDLAPLPVALLLGATSHALPAELDALLTRVGRDVPGAAVRLAPLDAAGLRRLAQWAMPAYDDTALDRLTRRLTADTAGLPLLAVEMLHAVALGHELDDAAPAWPATDRTLDHTLPGDLPSGLVAAIRVGFHRLGKDAQIALTALAVLEDPAPAALIGRTADLAGERLAAALDELEWERWVAATARGYGFVARLARRIVAEDLLTQGQRQRLLARAGR